MTREAPIAHAIVLAAGAGRRLGIPKAALRLCGEWVLPRLVRSLREGGVRTVHLVLGPEAKEALAQAPPHGADRELLNPKPERGRGSSLRIGLESLGEELPEVLLIHLCDVPLLSPEAVRSLLRAWAGAEGREGLLVRPVTPAGRGGHPLLIGRALLPELRALPREATLRDFLHADPRRRLDHCLRGDPGPFLDVDTPEQLHFLEELCRGEPGPSAA